jgi:sugar lactone lactonase YvrE
MLCAINASQRKVDMKKHIKISLLAVLFGIASLLTSNTARADNLYVANVTGDTVSQITPAGVLSIFAHGVHAPQGLAFDSAGNLYVRNFNTIEKFSSAGVDLGTFASTGLSNPLGLAFDSADNLYAANQGTDTIEKFTPAGVGSVFANSGLNGVQGLAFDSAGNLYAANFSGNSIEKFTPGGVGSVFASSIFTGSFKNPGGLAFDRAGNLYVANRGGTTIERFTPGGAASIFATTAGLNDSPTGLAFDSAGNLYVAYFNDNSIEKFTSTGTDLGVFASGGSLSDPSYIAFHTSQVAVHAAGFATPIPGGTGNFTSLPGAPSYSSSGQIAFYGEGAAGQQGIYRGIPGNPVKVADLNTAIPNGTGNFTAFFVQGPPIVPAIDGNNVAFFGAGSGGQQGIYVSVNGPPIRIADAATAIPGGTGNFTSFLLQGPPIAPNPSISGNNVAFFGAGSGGQQGVYVLDYVTISGPPIKIADTATAIPGGTGNFTAIPVEPTISGNNVAFLGNGSSGQQGVYRASSGPPIKVADLNTAIPGGSGNFTSFIPGNPITPAIDGTSVAFFGAGSGGQQGIYVSIPSDPVIPGNPIRIADTSTAIPGGAGNFTSFGDVSMSATDVAFLGLGANGQEGIYDMTGGALLDVVDLSDVLDGRSITGLSLSHTGLVGDPIAFQATFADGSQGMYIWSRPAVSPVGDFNADGVVNAADYVVWRKGLGTTFTQTDYDGWQRRGHSRLGRGRRP